MNNKNKALILIVDDNLPNIQVLGNIIEENHYEAALAMSGEQALDFVREEKPDLILLDIMMPGMDGYEVCRRLKVSHKTKDIPIIFLTAKTELEDKLKAFQSGAVDYITKPFLKEEVLARVFVHLQLKKNMEKLEKLSITDELTGSYNRRFAFDVLSREIQRAKRENNSFVLCYIDLDNLKQINDIYGHKEGDKLIKTLVNEINRMIRKTDYLFRMGGDEFLVIFPNTSLNESDELIARVRQQLHQKKFHDQIIDFCFGFSEFRYNDDKTIDELLNLADSKMYSEKTRKKTSLT